HGRRGGFPVQEAMDHRTAVQENEAELPAELFLWREYQCDLHAGVVHAHRAAAADRIAEEGTGEKGVFGRGNIGAHRPDQPAGCEPASEKRESGLQRKGWTVGYRPTGAVLSHPRGEVFY